MIIEPNSTVETDDASYTLVRPAGVGGFGTVWQVVRDGDGKLFAVKFMLEPDVVGMTRRAAKELVEKYRARFDHEIAIVDELNDIALAQEWADEQGYAVRTPQPFPEYAGRGVFKGLPFYVMEWLDPVNLYELNTDEKRVKFVSELCDAVATLHVEGYVHYDIKPANIMRRNLPEGSSGYEYALVDFGSVHEAESQPVRAEERPTASRTLSMLKDGRRIYPHTPGYADPTDDLHTINGDIYAIGQVIRDLFESDVPFDWNHIINKCISRNCRYRYEAVKELLSDVANLRKIRRRVYNRLRREHIDEKWKIAECSAGYPLVETDWVALTEHSKVANRKFGCLTIDLDDDPSLREHVVRIKGKLRLKRGEVLRLVGPGIVEADIAGDEGSLVIIIRDLVLHNTTRIRQPRNRVAFALGGQTYLDFANLSPADFQAECGGKRRIYQSMTASTFVAHSGLRTIGNLRDANLKAIAGSMIDPAYKTVMCDFYLGKNLFLHP